MLCCDDGRYYYDVMSVLRCDLVVVGCSHRCCCRCSIDTRRAFLKFYGEDKDEMALSFLNGVHEVPFIVTNGKSRPMMKELRDFGDSCFSPLSLSTPSGW